VTTLVTGAGGFAGQHLLRRLLARGGEVVGTTLDGSPPPPRVLTSREAARVRWVSMDLTSGRDVKSVVAEAAPDAVFHLAAQSSVGASFADPVDTWEVNATGTLRLLAALEARVPGARMLVISSGEVYGTVPDREQPIVETRRLDPLSPYGASKAAAEMAAVQAARRGAVAVVIARSFGHTGPGQEPRFALPAFAKQLVELRGRPGDDERVLRVGDLSVRRDLLDVRDVVAAYEVLLERGEPGEAYNVCSGRALALREVVGRMVELTGVPVRVEVDSGRLRSADIPLLLGSPERLEALGWEAAIPLERTLRDLLDSFEPDRPSSP
jgi:GDP-4-dehydro-6-deoxy-D-mannose reductase